MTELEWLASEDPQAMLAYVTRDVSGGDAVRPCRLASDRKLFLFAVGCCRQVWHRLTDERSRRALSTIEAFIEGSAGEKERAAAHYESQRANREEGVETRGRGPSWVVEWIAHKLVRPEGGRLSAEEAIRELAVPLPVQTALLRDIAGDPFQPVTLPWEPCECGSSGVVEDVTTGKALYHCLECRRPSRRSWLTTNVLSLARAAYDDRLPDGTLDPQRLAILADALEDAGCVRQHCIHCVDGMWGEWEDGTPIRCRCIHHDIVAHLRWGGPHVRGCWVLDLFLGV